MTDSTPARTEPTTSPEPEQEPSEGFPASMPLAILESVRQHDRPEEVLEAEDLPRSLPRRLGLTGVVDSQIHHYRVARKRRERISHGRLADLLRLVLRRPDCEPILREAGAALAREHSRKTLSRTAILGRFFPSNFAFRLAKRSLQRLLRRIAGGAPVTVNRDPFLVEIDTPVTARVDRWGIACVLYSAAIEETVRQTTGSTPHVHHSHCQAKGDTRCRWIIT